MHRFFTEDIRGGTACVTGEDVRHIRRVLRMREGDSAEICDGRGTDYAGVITSVSDGEVVFALSERRPSRGEPGIALTLYQALAKGAKFETVVQKAVELGVSAVVPVLTAFARPFSSMVARAILRASSGYVVSKVGPRAHPTILWE